MAADSGDLESALHDEEVRFLPEKATFQKNTCNGGPVDAFLSHEDLLRIYKDEPKWHRIRIVLLVLFWIVWVGLLAASVVVIVLTPKCPPVPSLAFWESKTGYWFDPFAFKDSDGDFVGDFKGLTEKLSYIKSVVGAGFLMLGSFVSGTFTGDDSRLGLVTDFYTADGPLGTTEDFRTLIKTSHRMGLEVVVTLDFNSVSISHKWVNRTEFLRKPLSTTAVSRDGQNASVTINGEQFYSVFGQNTVDLDLNSEVVVAELTNVVNYWLNEGVDGILLSGVAFYVDEDSPLPVKDVKNGQTNEWFTKYPTGQLFTNGTVNFVSRIRDIVDSVSKLTGRLRLLAVDAGDYGYGLGDEVDLSTKFLGTLDRPAAHMIISREFVKRRGWKSSAPNIAFTKSSIDSYDVMSGLHKKYLGLCTATPSDQRHKDIISLAATFLLPGTPLIYYGTELAMEPTQNLTSPSMIYPKGKVPFPNLSADDSSVSSHLPMPWDLSGVEYSSASSGNVFAEYLDGFAITETVESATSFGRGPTSLQLVQSLIQLRKKPNLLWGAFARLDLGPSVSRNDIELFTRQAEGFPATIVALIRKSDYGAAFNFANVCGRIVPKFIYPPNPDIVLDMPVDGSRVFLKTHQQPAVYVFDCA